MHVGGSCLPNNLGPDASSHDVGSSVVLATDQNWPDALTASYLASYLRTGVLLTPTGSLSLYTAQAIQNEGVSTVFIVGGNQAVNDSVENQLKNTPQFQCGGTNPRTNFDGDPLNLDESRLSGPTADGTAATIRDVCELGVRGSANVSGVPLYNGFGTNPYNNTSGGDGVDAWCHPHHPGARTAYSATDQSWQDVAPMSSMSYFEHLPILMPPTDSLGADAQTGLLDLGIQQVIEPGGPVAISGSG